MRLAYTAAETRATNVRVTIAYTGGMTAPTVNQRLTSAVDGHFAELGTFRIARELPVIVTVSNAGTDGFVSVDAVQAAAAAK